MVQKLFGVIAAAIIDEAQIHVILRNEKLRKCTAIQTCTLIEARNNQQGLLHKT